MTEMTDITDMTAITDITAMTDMTCERIQNRYDTINTCTSDNFANHSDTASVAMPLQTPVMRINLKFAGALDVNSGITHTEIYRREAVVVTLRYIPLTNETNESGCTHVR